MGNSIATSLRNLPSVETVLNTASATMLQERFGRAASTDAIRAVLAQARANLRAGTYTVPSAEQLALDALARLNWEDRSSPVSYTHLTLPTIYSV